MGEHEPHDQPADGPWPSDEQVGDIYAVDINDQGQIEQVEKLQPRPHIWVGSWSDYNNGVLHGRWLDAARDQTEVQADIDAMLAASPTAQHTGEPAEEWGIFDYDNFGALRLDEHEDLETVGRLARAVAEHGEAFAAYAEWAGHGEATVEGFQESYQGKWLSLIAYAEDWLREMGADEAMAQLPEWLQPYVQLNAASFAHDLEYGGDVHTSPASGGGGVWIFAG